MSDRYAQFTFNPDMEDLRGVDREFRDDVIKHRLALHLKVACAQLGTDDVVFYMTEPDTFSGERHYRVKARAAAS